MRIGIDLGGTKIAAGIVDDQGRVISRRKVPTGAERGYPAVRDDVVAVVMALMEESGLARDEVESVGIAAAGQISRESDTIIFSPNLNWHDAPLRQDVEKGCAIPTIIENDVNAAAYGEWRFGLAMEPTDLVGIFIGTGVGGGLIFNKKIYRGFTGVGGEVGHMTVDPHGYWCNCGNRGCFEACCGGAHVVERVQVRLNEGYRGPLREIIGGDTRALNTSHVEQGWLLGDELCRLVWGEMIECLGTALASLANLLNPEVIVLGGGVISGSRHLIDGAVEVMKKRAMAASLKGLRVERARLGEDAAIIGAAFLSSHASQGLRHE
jgi:glucokinase